MKIGVLTGGGDCPGLNAVIRAVVKASSLKYGWDVIGVEDGFTGLMTSVRVREMTPKSVCGILPTGGTILGTASDINPMKVKQFIDGKEQIVDLSRLIVKNANGLGLSSLICIGGDGTLRIANHFYLLGLPVIGIPKTIDNDILETDSTFGFHTAVNTATEALDKLHTTAESHRRVIVVEVMGRYAGWIALEAGISGGANVILIPEIPFQIEAVCKKIMNRYEHGAGFSIVVVAEGARPVGGEMSVIKRTEDGSVLRLGGIGNKVGEEIAARTNVDVRVTVLGHIQRGGSPVPFDRSLATRFGVAACDLAAKQQFGQMVCLKGGEIQSVSLQDATRGLKFVSTEGNEVKSAEALGVSFGR
ncbi:MAG: ATP-dependent 6-phosphofructokinase [Nitrospirae bacterium]|nr:ATP-dependent 6-phosphofructokinase [Candidatus Troglogloeales bacterium]